MDGETPASFSAYNRLSARVLYRLAAHRRGKCLDGFIGSFLVPMEGGYESFEWADTVLRRLFSLGYLRYADGRFMVTEEFRRQFPHARQKGRTYREHKEDIARFRATLATQLSQEAQEYPPLPETIWNEELYEQALQRFEKDSQRACCLGIYLPLLVIVFVLALFFRPFMYISVVMLAVLPILLLGWWALKRKQGGH